MLEPFDQIWVPDFAATPNLSGALSHNVDLKNKLFFIGPLSRFDGLAKGSDSISLLIILSGQEPQRTELENIVLSQITDDMQSVVLVRGLPNRSEVMKVEQQNLKVYNHLPAQELERLIADSSIVLCRSGYSSIMDMAAMGKQVLLIPTPGQTEQEYLANYLSGKGLAFSVLQNELDLSSNLQSVVKCKELSMVNTNLEEKLEQALKKL
jgi:predicted glycosyltransferase